MSEVNLHTNPQPLVSVLMTAYNREKYIGSAIESVLASAYPHFELIIVDDGSTDSTFSIINDFQTRDPRIKAYRNELNLGDYPNRNKAASYASGKYLKYIDSDDHLYPLGLAMLVSMMELFPEAGWGLCSLYPDMYKPFPFQLSPKEAYLYHFQGPGLFHKAPLSSIIKRDVFIEVGGFNPIRMAGDFDMWLRLGKTHPVVLMPDGVVWNRQHAEQEVRDFDLYIPVYEKLKIESLRSPDCPIPKTTVDRIIKKDKRKILRQLLVSFILIRKSRLKLNLRSLKAYG